MDGIGRSLIGCFGVLAFLIFGVACIAIAVAAAHLGWNLIR